MAFMPRMFRRRLAAILALILLLLGLILTVTQWLPRLVGITTAEYPTRAVRPPDGRLDCSRISRVHGIAPADWRTSLSACLDALVGPAP